MGIFFFLFGSGDHTRIYTFVKTQLIESVYLKYMYFIVSKLYLKVH